MSEKGDKFAVFGKKFARLDDEGQDRLIKAAHELLKIHNGIQGMSAAPLFNDIKVPVACGGFTNEAEKFC